VDREAAVNHLRLVSNAPPERRPLKREVGLTEKEGHRVAIALRNFIRAMGTRECAADVLKVHTLTLSKITLRRKRAGAAFALRLARYIGVPLETLLAGQLTEAGLCPTCGAMRLPR
jgi:hypothetical protein